MGQTKSKKTKGSKKKKKLKRRNNDNVLAIRETITRQIKKNAELEPDTMTTISRDFRMAYSSDSLVTGRVRNARSMESDVF